MNIRQLFLALTSSVLFITCTIDDIDLREQTNITLNTENNSNLASGLTISDFVNTNDCDYDSFYVVYSVEDFNHPDFLEKREEFINEFTSSISNSLSTSQTCSEFKIPTTLNFVYVNAINNLIGIEETTLYIGNEEIYYEKWGKLFHPFETPQSGSRMDIDL